MNRSDFIRKLIQLLLFSLLAIISVILGRKIVSVNECSSCPGNGICSGEAECSKYLPQ